MAKFRVGQSVVVQVDARQNNGGDVAPGLVTRVSEEDDNRVNLRVFLDDGSDQRLGGVKMVNNEPKKDDDDNDERVAWPAR